MAKQKNAGKQRGIWVSGMRWNVTMQIAFLQKRAKKQQLTSQFATTLPIRCHESEKFNAGF